MRLLVVEDDASLVEALKLKFQVDNYDVDCLANGTLADRAIRFNAFDAIVLDLSLPGLDGLDVLHRMRLRGDRTPVLILSARGGDAERVQGLELGADDYLSKPFSSAELSARVKALIRRAVGWRDASLRYGRLRFDVSRKAAYVDDQLLDLSGREASLLEVLLLNFRRLVTKEMLLSQLESPRVPRRPVGLSQAGMAACSARCR